MLISEWMEVVKKNTDVLAGLIESYHPGSSERPRKTPKVQLPITTPAAERLSESIRESISEKENSKPLRPADRFRKAVEERDSAEITRLLSSTWFGVPESTYCWSMPGFSVAVDLLEDPPEQED